MSGLQTGYARTDDGLKLYWRSAGEGPALVCCNGVGVSTFFWKYVVSHHRRRFRVIVWDYRGHGRSLAPAEGQADLSMARNAHDLAAVLHAAGVTEPAILVGHSMGCQVILEFARLFPAQVAALVPMFGTFARPLDTFYDNPKSAEYFAVISRLQKSAGKLGARALLPIYDSPLAYPLGQLTGLIDRYYASRQDVERYTEHMGRMRPDVFIGMVERMQEHDLTEDLPAIRVPTLVVAGEKDVFTPMHRSRRMAELIPGAELLVLADGSHAGLIEYPEQINRRMDRFLDERVLRSSTAPAAAAL